MARTLPRPFPGLPAAALCCTLLLPLLNEPLSDGCDRRRLRS